MFELHIHIHVHEYTPPLPQLGGHYEQIVERAQQRGQKLERGGHTTLNYDNKYLKMSN